MCLLVVIGDSQLRLAVTVWDFSRGKPPTRLQAIIQYPLYISWGLSTQLAEGDNNAGAGFGAHMEVELTRAHIPWQRTRNGSNRVRCYQQRGQDPLCWRPTFLVPYSSLVNTAALRVRVLSSPLGNATPMGGRVPPQAQSCHDIVRLSHPFSPLGGEPHVVVLIEFVDENAWRDHAWLPLPHYAAPPCCATTSPPTRL